MDAEVGVLWRETHQQRLAGARTVVDLLSRVDGLAAGLSAERAADIVTVYNDPGLHRHLVGDCGWSQQEFRDWLARTLHSQLLPEPVSKARRRSTRSRG